MSDCLAPFTGFGDDPATSVKFAILREGVRLPQWSGGPRIVQLPIANSDRTVDQTLGREPHTVRWRIWFPTRAEYGAMDGLLGARATLRYRWGLTRRIGGEHERILGTDYLKLTGVKLLRMSDEQLAVDDTAEATVTFQRQYGAGS